MNAKPIQLNIRLLFGEIWAEQAKYRISGEIEVEQNSYNKLMDISMEVTARHIGKVLADDDELPITPWPDETTS